MEGGGAEGWPGPPYPPKFETPDIHLMVIKDFLRNKYIFLLASFRSACNILQIFACLTPLSIYNLLASLHSAYIICLPHSTQHILYM